MLLWAQIAENPLREWIPDWHHCVATGVALCPTCRLPPVEDGFRVVGKRPAPLKQRRLWRRRHNVTLASERGTEDGEEGMRFDICGRCTL